MKGTDVLAFGSASGWKFTRNRKWASNDKSQRTRWKGGGSREHGAKKVKKETGHVLTEHFLAIRPKMETCYIADGYKYRVQ